MPEGSAIPFNRPSLVGNEHLYIDEALASGKLSGNGEFCRRCSTWLLRRVGGVLALPTPSCTAALEITAILAELEPGDEVIVPDFAFVSSANAFALRRAVPVFVDVEPTTLNVDPSAIEAAITPRTRAIVVIHYGGVACDMDRINAIASRNNLYVIEDAAHSIEASYRGRSLGSLGHLSTFSFHETKNVQCGEGGALVVNDPSLAPRAEIVQEKGTDRNRFFRGLVDKYTWQDVGSSYLMSEVSAAFLWAQLEHAAEITAERRGIWNEYFEAFAELEDDGLIRRPVVPKWAVHSGHLFYLLLPTQAARDATLEALNGRGVGAVFHYLPLHSSPGGERYGRVGGDLGTSIDASRRLLRLPLWAGLGSSRTEAVIDAVRATVPDTAAAFVR